MNEEQRRASIRKAVAEHDANKVDKVTVRLPKGTKDRIYALGENANAFIIRAVLETLDWAEGVNAELEYSDPDEPA